ncbi:BON domain-containing protein [Teredinibacter franksiae]|uniref:BON domain-containing protein n=1 Tax=Teredinibacter franksiae TaxID=2761453 RepID=UPI00162684B5|nr:BON domain-containing protein [Teredinibacter franksiae]
MKKLLVLLTLATLPAIISGCVSIVDATTNGPINTDPGKRSMGDKIDDSSLSTIVAVNIRKASPELDKAHINVYSFNQIVLLTGEVPTKEGYELAGKTARKVARVRQVYNELQAREKSDFFSRTNDEYLELKINSKLMSHRDIDASRVKVIVEDEIVFLMGIMTLVQADKMTDVVASTSGIKKVIRAIEYIE